jgi:hypothetical protein
MLPLNTDLQADAIQAQVDMPKGMSQVFQYVNENYCIVKEFHDTIVYRLENDSVCE